MVCAVAQLQQDSSCAVGVQTLGGQVRMSALPVDNPGGPSRTGECGKYNTGLNTTMCP